MISRTFLLHKKKKNSSFPFTTVFAEKTQGQSNGFEDFDFDKANDPYYIYTILIGKQIQHYFVFWMKPVDLLKIYITKEFATQIFSWVFYVHNEHIHYYTVDVLQCIPMT